jgi:hypothetical protein
MGLLSELLYEDEKDAGTATAPAAEIRSASVAAIPVVAKAMAVPAVLEQASAIDQPAPTSPAHPCPTCNSHLAWESIYRDGVLRCDQCELAPSAAMVGGWWGLCGSTDFGFAWVPVVFEGAARREALAKDRYGNASHSSRGASSGHPATFEATDAALALLTPTDDSPPRWSPPDADGWCWGVDAEGATHMRRRQFVEDGVAAMGEGLQWLGETEVEWRARMASVDEVWREWGG